MQQSRLAMLICGALCVSASASAQEVHGVIAYGSEAGHKNSIAYGFAWNFPAKDAAVAEAINACISSGGTNCVAVAWFANGCGALAVEPTRQCARETRHDARTSGRARVTHL